MTPSPTRATSARPNGCAMSVAVVLSVFPEPDCDDPRTTDSAVQASAR
jgi:hypothetical protein